jgi:phosphohistidine phosphatase
MKLWLARHGEAVDPDRSTSDHARQLTDVGRQQVSQLARWLLQREEAPELILHSPLVRARQTAETIASEVGAEAIVMEEQLLSPGFHTANLLRRLSDSGMKRIVCVGHQPDMSHCLSELVGGGRHLYSPGTIAGIEFGSVVAVGAGSLRWLADPFWFD